MFSVVFQDFKLYNFSIKENICFNNYETLDFNNAIEKCDLKEIINKLDDKENTYVDKIYNHKGINFSGGELQKIAIARAIYKKGLIYVFDEPTSSLDPISESKILNLYSTLVLEHTSLIISHRLSIASLCDNIIVLDKGKIVETGTFDELINNKKYFYTKYKMQSDLYK